MKFVIVIIVLLTACSSKNLKLEQEKTLQTNQEFDQVVKIEEQPVSTVPADKQETQLPSASLRPADVKKILGPRKKINKKDVQNAASAKQTIHEPTDVEDGTGFMGRRPIVDPFRVGEKVVLEVSHFAFTAGTISFSVLPFANVNGRKSYQFVTEVQTYPTFSKLIYSAQDKAVTWLDYELLIPRVFTLHVKESGQQKEARSFFDFEKLEATYWEKKVTEKNGIEEKKQKWNILPWSQNVFSAVFYMRTFAWETGKEYAFRVADDETNLVFKGTALRREVLKTKLGPMKSIVIRPQISVKGIFKPMGDILFWLSDDDKKLVLRIESKIKIGTLVSEVISLENGAD
jgi:hypothetical protein